MKLVILKTFKWSSFGLLKATKLVIVRSSFCNFSMNTKPGNSEVHQFLPNSHLSTWCDCQAQLMHWSRREARTTRPPAPAPAAGSWGRTNCSPPGRTGSTPQTRTSKSADYANRRWLALPPASLLTPLLQVHQVNSHYCQSCAYKKGICAMCGHKILDTKRYKQSSV